MPTFSERLKMCRETKNVTRQEIADLLQITVRAYQHYETGTREPKIEGLKILADYFDVSLDYLVGRSDDPTRH